MAPGGGSRQVFGQTMHKKKASRYQRQFGGGAGNKSSSATVYRAAVDDEETRAQYRRRKQAAGEVNDEEFGLERFAVGGEGTGRRQRRGWLYNMISTTVSVLMRVASGFGSANNSRMIYR